MKRWLLPSLHFGIGILSLSWSIAAVRGLWEQPSLPRLSVTLFCVGLFIISMFMMGYYMYAAERAKGTLVHRIGVYERILHNRGIS